MQPAPRDSMVLPFPSIHAVDFDLPPLHWCSLSLLLTVCPSALRYLLTNQLIPHFSPLFEKAGTPPLPHHAPVQPSCVRFGPPAGAKFTVHCVPSLITAPHSSLIVPPLPPPALPPSSVACAPFVGNQACTASTLAKRRPTRARTRTKSKCECGCHSRHGGVVAECYFPSNLLIYGGHSLTPAPPPYRAPCPSTMNFRTTGPRRWEPSQRRCVPPAARCSKCPGVCHDC